MAELVSFDGPNKLIVVNDGETSLEAKTDIYSAWKRWVETNQAHWLQALRTTGGDPIGGGQTISPYYFLLNGWRLRPYEGDHQLTIDGNLFVDGGGNPFVPTVGDFNVLVELQTSAIATTTTLEVTAYSPALSEAESDRLFELPLEQEISDGVWSQTLTGSPSGDSASAIVQKIQTLVKLLPGAL